MDYEDLLLERLDTIIEQLHIQSQFFQLLLDAAYDRSQQDDDDDDAVEDTDDCDDPFENVQPIGTLEYD